jgi:hypothetical protein
MNGFILITGAILTTSDKFTLSVGTWSGAKFSINLCVVLGALLMIYGWFA